MEAPSARAQASDLERIVNYEWPSSPTAPLPSIMTNISISTEETDEAAVSRLLEPEPEKSTGNIRAPSPTPAAAEPEHKDIAPALRVQESPEPDIPLALQTAASRGVTTTPSVPATPLGESTTGPGESNPSQPSLEERLADIPPMPMFEALRVIVMVRLQQQTQTREERVDPVLMDNLSKVEPVLPSIATPTDLIREVESGERLQACKETLESTKESLEIRFAKRQMDLNEKVERLRTEYLALHQQWTTHCAKLDEVAKNLALQEAAATAGRTTRRSAASMGDAVRSDLEMEQIIASLGNEELTDATHLGARNAAMIPDMIAVVVGEIEYAYDDTNNEVEDPAKYYAPRTGTYDWTEEEVSTFVEKFAQYPKQFGIIADFLPHKTAAQCVTFYYLHKNKHIDFRKVVASRVVKRKRGGRKQKNNALLTDIRQRDAEAAPTRRRKGGGSLPVPEPRKPSTRRAVLQSENTPTATPTPEPESEPRRRRARNTAKVTAPEEEETNNDEDATPKPAKRGKRTRKPRQPSSTPISTPTITEDIPPFANAIFNEHGQLASVNEQQASNAVWTTSDKSMLAELLMRYGENYDRIATFMPGKTATQIFQFYQTRGAELRPSRITPSLSMAPTPPTTQAYRLSEPLIDGGLSREPYRIRTHSGETSASSSAFTASPIPPSMRHSPFDPVYTSPNTPQQSTPILTRGSFDVPPLPHPAQYPGNNNMSHLSIPPIPMPDNRIANPSPFATSSPFPDFTYSHSPIPHLSAVTTLPEESRMNKRGSAGSSMAFDTAPNFVPPPQTWTHAPLGTTDDLVAYLEHRTRLSQQK
ncbi:hypothetical protein BDY19DRAFT_771185 [Irpex rosettiformis]|uniref:Uncharacterized protein n=1 Tax=Irpex rosettiformis TaxID=378272 RepID=A0ACB8U7Q8_9APHY|nr:hypothetical protein BDY19DRAFT_771185 [Irpex rosettiformis]